MHQWLTMDEAIEHCRVGASIWRWASSNEGEDPEIVLASAGDNLTVEVLAAASILREVAPDWRVRVVNVTDLVALGIPQKYPHGFDEDQFQRLFPLDVPVVFNFHGYTAAIKQLCWERPGASARLRHQRVPRRGIHDHSLRHAGSKPREPLSPGDPGGAEDREAAVSAVAAHADEIVRAYQRKHPGAHRLRGRARRRSSRDRRLGLAAAVEQLTCRSSR